MSTPQALLFFGIIAGATMLVRFLPFLLFPEDKEIPGYVRYLGKVLPYTVIGMLTVYCLRNTPVLRYPYALPETIAIGLIILLQLWRKNMLLSIGGGTLVYMVLIQQVFV
ncbi:MAG: AzlD domain-containing protein [Clostridiales bacterium]|nr:AzlD domain-containing protein [Clostridiales bacterium]